MRETSQRSDATHDRRRAAPSSRRLLWLLCLAACVAVAARAEAPGPSSVLFVGNSFTYYNNSLHNHYQAFVREAFPGREFEARAMTIAGGKLYEHYGLARLLRDAGWDVVVLQGHSLEPIENEPRFREAARRHAKAIRRHGGRPVLFMTWAYSDRPEMTEALAAAYTALGATLDADVVPVGLAFARVTKERPDIALRTADRRHPTLAGTYLAASVFFATLHGESPEALGYSAGLDAATAAYLRRAAAGIVNDFRRP